MNIERIIEDFGLSNIANSMGVKPQRVANWRVRGIPSDQVLQFCKATGWKITPHVLRPDIYPHPLDGIPAADRTQEAA